MDVYEERIGKAVAAIREEQSEEEILKAIYELEFLEIQEVIAELCLCVEDATVDKNIYRLLSIAHIPLPDDPERIINAVNNNDITELHAYCKGELPVLLASMLLLIASLQEAGERI